MTGTQAIESQDTKDTVETPINGQLSSQSMDDWGKSQHRYRLDLQYEDPRPHPRAVAQLGDHGTEAVPDRTPVKLAITILPELHDRLRDYARCYAEAYGSEEPVTELIPAMLAAFLETDRGFARSRGAGK